MMMMMMMTRTIFRIQQKNNLNSKIMNQHILGLYLALAFILLFCVSSFLFNVSLSLRHHHYLIGEPWRH